MAAGVRVVYDATPSYEKIVVTARSNAAVQKCRRPARHNDVKIPDQFAIGEYGATEKQFEEQRSCVVQLVEV